MRNAGIIVPKRAEDKKNRSVYSSMADMRNFPRLCPLALFVSALVLFPSPVRSDSAFVAGTSSGLFSVGSEAAGQEAFGGEIRSIVPVPGGWYVLGSGSVFFTGDFARFEARSGNLPTKVLQRRVRDGFVAERVPQEIVALAADPLDGTRLAACTSEAVYFSRDGGKQWVSLGSPSVLPGFKAVSFGPRPGPPAGRAGYSPAVWVSHSIRGVHAIETESKSAWTDMSAGLPKVFGQNFEEVSSFAWDGAGNLYAGLSFLGSVCRWAPAQPNGGAKASFAPIYSDRKDFGWAESLALRPDGSLVFQTAEGTKSFLAGKIADEPELDREIARIRSLLPSGLNCMGFRSGQGGFALGELWRFPEDGKVSLSQSDSAASRRESASGLYGLYLQTGFVASGASRDSYFALMKARGLDSLVIDMKDDYGRLRFVPKSPLLAAEGRTGDPLDLENFVAEAKRRGIYLIARIVVFKDETLAAWNSGALAVRDAKSKGPWKGLRTDGQPYGEQWVDPYSPRVWEYNIEIAKEIAARGFDEVQFDYIRFPTDGTNLSDARFPARIEGMTQESALESFLAYARQELSVPISVDIYGANGWYRSGVRTGQDLEMLSKYADVICPMLYPSHFEQAFLAQEPADARPYRIYRLGTLRAQAIARNRALIRPYVQAFYLDVSYDRVYYGPRYVLDEVRGVREGANQGMTFWNNSGRYDDLPD